MFIDWPETNRNGNSNPTAAAQHESWLVHTPGKFAPRLISLCRPQSSKHRLFIERQQLSNYSHPFVTNAEHGTHRGDRGACLLQGSWTRGPAANPLWRKPLAAFHTVWRSHWQPFTQCEEATGSLSHSVKKPPAALHTTLILRQNDYFTALPPNHLGYAR